MDDVTSKGIWRAGIVALSALAAFCIWHHAPTGAPTVAPITQAPQSASTTAPSVSVPKAVLPPSVTGPTSDATIRMPSGESSPASSRATAVIAAPKVIPNVVAKVEPKIEMPEVETSKVETSKVETSKVEAPKVEAPKLEAPKLEATPIAIAPKPAAQPKRALTKAKKKRLLLAKRSKIGCEYKRESVVRSVCFNFNSSRLSASSKAKLNAIIPTLKNAKQFELNGFADSVGNKTYNSNLSERRSKAVLKYLASKGIDTSKVSVKSFGSEKAEKQQLGKSQRERRVDVLVIP
jgi:outer membrane protein OmpA-like peptidoglycan-associated protein